MENIVLSIKMLQNENYANLTKELDLVCGKYYLPTTFKEGIKQIKRFKNV